MVSISHFGLTAFSLHIVKQFIYHIVMASRFEYCGYIVVGLNDIGGMNLSIHPKYQWMVSQFTQCRQTIPRILALSSKWSVDLGIGNAMWIETPTATCWYFLNSWLQNHKQHSRATKVAQTALALKGLSPFWLAF